MSNVIKFRKDEFFLQFFYDEEIGKTHVEDHGFSFSDIYLFLTSEKFLESKRKDGSFESIGFVGKKGVKIVYRKIKITKTLKHYFIITAFPFQLDADEIDLINEMVNI